MIEFASERLIQARENAGMRREALAVRTGLSYPFLQALELGSKTPSRSALFRLARRHAVAHGGRAAHVRIASFHRAFLRPGYTWRAPNFRTAGTGLRVCRSAGVRLRGTRPSVSAQGRKLGHMP
jgi:transcriptional regulator with XRE-family HTH domain